MSEVLKIFLRMVVVLLALSFIFAVAHGVRMFSKSTYFTAKTVQINGVINADIKKVMTYSQELKNENLFNIKNASQDILNDPWIKKVQIKKVYPDKLEIDIYERKTVMKFKNKNKCYFYSIEGELIPADCNNVKVFDNANLNYDKLYVVAEIVKFLTEDRVSGIVLTPSHIVINKGNYAMYASYDLENFRKNIRYAEGLATLYRKINYIDLRVPGKIYINGVKNES